MTFKISMLTAANGGIPGPFQFDDNNWQTWGGCMDICRQLGQERIEKRDYFSIPPKSDSICSVYNRLAKIAVGDILCFIHLDAMIRSKVWIKIIFNFINEHPEAGVVGLVGSDRMVPNPLYPLLYANGEDHYFGKLVQGNTTREFQPVDRFKEVVAVDGFCFFIRKEVLEKIGGFDENTYDQDGPCFHMYDIDLCFEARKAGYKNYVIDGILAQHLSIGKLDDGWHKARKIFIQKWGEKEIIIG